MPVSKPKSKRIVEARGFRTRLVYYPAGLRQPYHHHDGTQISFLVSGCFEEESEGRTFRPLGRQAGVMPAGHSHGVRYGREGALMLAIDCPERFDSRDTRRQWRRFDKSTGRKLGLLADNPLDADRLAGELIAGFSRDPEGDPPEPEHTPRWLRDAVDRIVAEPDVSIAQLAQDAGVHRVHFSRSFQRCFGISASEFRLLRKSAAAMRRTIDGECGLAQAALEGGFADQAHWARTCRMLAGIPPGQIRRMLSA